MGGSSQSPRNGKDNRIVFSFPGTTMGILDEAIREHLELKRQHGADDSELQQLEDEAFGPPDRPGGEAEPDGLAEAPTEFMAQREAPEAEDGPEGRSPRDEAATRIADLQEAPPPPEEEAAEPEPEPAAEEAPEEFPPVEEEQPAGEHEAVRDIASAPSTGEGRAIAEQPTEMYDTEEELGAAEESPAPSEEDLADEEVSGPRLVPVDPLDAERHEGEAESGGDFDEAEGDDDDFWDEQRLSDELDQALDAPLDEAGEDEETEDEAAPGEEGVEARGAGEEDVLEETPDFLEESEDEESWFEQKPPKDFDFGD